MAYEIKPLPGPLGAEVVGLDLKTPLSAEVAAAINRAFADNIVLVFRDQDLTAQQLLAAAEGLGEPMIQHLSQFKVPECPLVSYVSNQEKTDTGAPKLLGKAWHTDHSFQREPPKATMLHGVELPRQGGDTWFANMRLAYEELPGALKHRVEGLDAIHAYRESREIMSRDERGAEMLSDEQERATGIVHPVVRTHDERGSRSIYINPLRIKRFIGMGPDDSTDLLAELTAHATGDAFTHAHAWARGDVVLWDNRQSLHRVEHNYDLAEKRLMHRIILKGDAPK